MATERISFDPDDGYVLVVADTVDSFLLENGNFAPVRIVFADTVPNNETEDYHTLHGREGITRAGPGNVYALAEYEGSSVVVTGE